MSISSVKAGEAYIELTTRDNKLLKGLDRAQARLKAFSDSVNAVGRSMLKMSAAMAVPFGLAAKRFADFDDQMRLVQGITGMTDEELKKLTDTAKRLGRETSYTAAQVAAGMVALSRMGFTAEETNRAISDFMNLDRATGMNDLAQSAEIASAAMRSFGLSASDSSRIADVLTATANGSSQYLEDLGEALRMGATNAHMANATLEDTAALLGVLANMGIKGSMAGSALAKTFQRLSSGKGVDILAGKGIKTTDASGNLRSMRDILIDIAAVTEKMGSAEKISFLTDVFDVRGVKGGGLISGNIKSLDEMMKKISESSGLAARTAEKMDSGIGGTFRKLLSAIESVGLEIGDAIAKFIKPFIDSVSDILKGLAKWIKAHQDVGASIVRFTAQVAAAGAGLIIFSKTLKIVVAGIALLKIAVSALIVVFAALQAAVMSLAAAPALAIVAFASLMTGAVVAIITIVESLQDSLDNLKNDFGAAFDSIKAVITESMPAIRQAVSMGDLAGAAKIGLAALKVAFLEGLLPLKKLWADFSLTLSDTWTFASGTVSKQAVELWYGLLAGLKAVGNSIADAWDSIWNSVIGSFDSAIAYIKKMWTKLNGFFDSSVNVDAEIRKIDTETEAGRRSRQNQAADNAIRRNGELRTIAEQSAEASRIIDEKTQSDFVENRKKYEESLAGAAEQIRSAKEEWRNAIEEARRKTQEKSDSPVEEKKQQIEQISSSLASKTDTKSIAGFDPKIFADAFSSEASKDKTAERTASASEKTAKTVERLYNKIEDGWTLA